MDNVTFIDASKARADFFKILDWVYFNDKSFLIKKAGIPIAEISKPKSLLKRKNIVTFAGAWSDIDNKKILNIIYEGRKDKGKPKRKLPNFS